MYFEADTIWIRFNIKCDQLNIVLDTWEYRGFERISWYTFVLTIFSSCVKHRDSPGYEYVDDMFRSQAIEAYIDYGLVGDKVNDTLKNTI